MYTYNDMAFVLPFSYIILNLFVKIQLREVQTTTSAYLLLARIHKIVYLLRFKLNLSLHVQNILHKN
ncbi:hypothetical protein SAMN05421766_103164 [Zobellia uliginosa]|uniref:Uncharacterized protein n=1 Tax=Zobellia uliginosa TaxID=143224 RepID=A0ABY1KVA1_9FLAO|nr:hypothetical protein SAMN05421766_103164 [Zobellia uliginosa]